MIMRVTLTQITHHCTNERETLHTTTLMALMTLMPTHTYMYVRGIRGNEVINFGDRSVLWL